MKADNLSKKAFFWLFHIVLSLMIIDWAVILPFSVKGVGLYELAFLLLGATCLVRLWVERGEVFRSICRVLRSSVWCVITLVAYLIAGVVTLFYSPNLSYALTKYVVVVQMLFFGVCLFYYLATYTGGSAKALLTVFGNLGFSAVVCGIWGMLDFFFPGTDLYPPVVSPIQDYNQYTTILLVGFISGGYYILRCIQRPVKRYLCLTVLIASAAVPVFAGGSRRSLVLMMGLLGLLAGYLAVELLVKYIREKNMRHLAVSLCALVLCCAVTYLFGNSVATRVAELANQPLVPPVQTVEPATEPEPTPPTDVPETSAPTDAPAPTEPTPPEPVQPTEPAQPTEPPASSLAQDRLVASSGFGKREIIWDAAIEEIRQSNTRQLLIGHGDGYETDFYDDLDKPLANKVHRWYAYTPENPAAKNWMNPHNLFLHDMLVGGLMLLTLQLSIILVAVISTLRAIRKEPFAGIVLGLLYGVLMITLLLSSGRGILANKFFWLFTMLQIGQNYVLTQLPKKGA